MAQCFQQAQHAAKRGDRNKAIQNLKPAFVFNIAAVVTGIAVTVVAIGVVLNSNAMHS